MLCSAVSLSVDVVTRFFVDVAADSYLGAGRIGSGGIEAVQGPPHARLLQAVLPGTRLPSSGIALVLLLCIGDVSIGY